MEEISLKVRKDDDVLPYRLSCHLHGTVRSFIRYENCAHVHFSQVLVGVN
jgi:hypothetical protein